MLSQTFHSPHADVRIDIVDVGHGSCVVVRASDTVILIDTGPNGAVLEYLRTESINQIDVVIISHADTDHIGGLSALLANGIPISRIIWNGDSAKRSEIWMDLVYQLDELKVTDAAVIDEEAAEGLSIETTNPAVEVSVLAPRTRLRRIGPGGVDRTGARITSNSVSVVAHVRVDGKGLLLVPGDLDAVGFAHLADPSLPDLRSKYLLLPHHGGRMGSPRVTVDLVNRLIGAVEPEIVLVSNGRGRYDNPRPDVLEAVRLASPAMPVACTQLSALCSPNPQPRDATSGPHSAGWLRGHACAATMQIRHSDSTGVGLDLSDHAQFVAERVVAPLCKVTSSEPSTARPTTEG